MDHKQLQESMWLEHFEKYTSSKKIEETHKLELNA
jgi:hypothetical protein